MNLYDLLKRRSEIAIDITELENQYRLDMIIMDGLLEMIKDRKNSLNNIEVEITKLLSVGKKDEKNDRN